MESSPSGRSLNSRRVISTDIPPLASIMKNSLGSLSARDAQKLADRKSNRLSKYIPAGSIYCCFGMCVTDECSIHSIIYTVYSSRIQSDQLGGDFSDTRSGFKCMRRSRSRAKRGAFAPGPKPVPCGYPDNRGIETSLFPAPR